MVYVKVYDETESYYYTPLYAVIDGRNESLRGFIDYGSLYFPKEELWVWKKANPNFVLSVISLKNQSVLRNVSSPVPILNSSWENPEMHIFGTLLYIHPISSGDVLVYSILNYSLLSHWRDEKFVSMNFCAYDPEQNLIFGAYQTWGS